MGMAYGVPHSLLIRQSFTIPIEHPLLTSKSKVDPTLLGESSANRKFYVDPAPRPRKRVSRSQELADPSAGATKTSSSKNRTERDCDSTHLQY